MKVMTWNVMGNRGIGAKRRTEVVDVIREADPDVVLLQEVHRGRGLPEYLAGKLNENGLAHAVFGPTEPKQYGNAVLSRWPLTEVPVWQNMPWPQPVLRCNVEHPDGRFEVLSVHIPNGSANGWLKIEVFEALADGLESIEGPFIVGGDFNEPKTILGDGTVIPFTMKKRADGSWHAQGKLKRKGGRFPRQRWVDAVRSILGRHAVAGIRHAAREVHGVDTVWETHATRSSPRFFDHLLASADWRVDDAWLVEGSLRGGVSDHSAVAGELLMNHRPT